MNLEEHILATIYQKNKAEPVKILFPEAENKKIQEVAFKLFNNTFFYDSKEIKIRDIIEPVLLFHENEVIPQELSSLTIIKTTDRLNLAQKLYEIRKEKGLTLEQAKELVNHKNYYGMMLLELGVVDGFVGGINYKTSDILRPALQIIKTKKEIVSSVFIMNRNEEIYFFSDCSININPSFKQLEAIASSTIDFVLDFNLKSNSLTSKNLNVAMLSYSTNGSGSGESVDKVKLATKNLVNTWKSQEQVNIIGEIQFDAAFNQEVRAKKFPDLKNIKGSCNIFVFPSLESGNIGYKIAQRLGGFKAIGPVVLGLKKPVNDLSRGASVDDIYKTALITCVQLFLK